MTTDRDHPVTDGAVEAALSRVLGEIESTIALIERRLAEQRERVTQAEMGPHGRSDVVQAERGRKRDLLEAVELLESARSEVEEAGHMLGLLDVA